MIAEVESTMDAQPHPFDVCMVCALPEEARALLHALRPYCDGAIAERSSSRYQYSYCAATIRNKSGEPLALHISWLPRYGPTEMTLHLARVLEECQPRIAIMTGICAGDVEQVRLGDLVVAERTFTSDSGKFTLDEHGRQVHLHDTLTYQLDAAILQFLGLFDEWKPLVAALPRPPTQPEASREVREVRCHLEAMASGSAVRADSPFRDVRVPVRGTAALDMEGAAFALAASRHHHTPWLIVKGVCDYDNEQKNDAYHDYAARASAAYALSFLQAYATNERLPRRGGASLTSQAEPPRIWNIPYPRNPVFTGREEILAQLARTLQPGTAVALSHPYIQAISGLGGIGKTQIALEYAYRHRHDYQAILWVSAETRESLIASYVSIATLLRVPEHAAKKQAVIVKAVKQWLQAHHDWLLILDNADDLALLPEFLPPAPGGHLLLTTRAAATGRLAYRIEVETLSPEQGAFLLLRRAGKLPPEAALVQASEPEITLAMQLSEEPGGLPLAIDQAGAYLEETRTDVLSYRQLFEQHRAELLRRRGAFAHDYPASVATTWSLSFEQVKATHPASADLLSLCAYLAPDAIAEEVFVHGAPFLGPVLAPVAADAFSFNQVVEALLAYSLISRDPERKLLSIHRLVQAVLQETMQEEERRIWAERGILAIHTVFPRPEKENWPQCERLLIQAVTGAQMIEQYQIKSRVAGSFLNKLAAYLQECGHYPAAEPLYKQALYMREQSLGPDHPEVGYLLNNLANLYREQGKYAEAEPLLQRTLHIHMKSLGPEHLDVAYPLNALALLYFLLGKYAEAEPLYQRALHITKQHLVPDHPLVAQPLNGLAELYREQSKYTEAESFYQRALHIWKHNPGPNHPAVATALNGLAALYGEQGKYTEAEPLYQQALHILEQHLDPEHPDLSHLLNGLAELYRKQDRYAEAETLYQRALHIREQSLGPDHPDLATVLNGLALLYKKQGKYVETEPLFKRALVIREKALGPDHPHVAYPLTGLATLYREQGKYTEAEPLYQRALAIREQQVGPEHPDTAETLHDLAILREHQGCRQEALVLYHRALAVREQALGSEHPKTRATRERLTALRERIGQAGGAPPEDDSSAEQSE